MRHISRRRSIVLLSSENDSSALLSSSDNPRYLCCGVDNDDFAARVLREMLAGHRVPVSRGGEIGEQDVVIGFFLLEQVTADEAGSRECIPRYVYCLGPRVYPGVCKVSEIA